MQDNAMLNKTVKIVGAETKQMSNQKYMTKFKDSDGDTYTMFHTKVDGNDTRAYQAFKTFPMSGIGSLVEIAYKEDSFSKDGKTYMSRKVMGLKLMGAPKDDVPQMQLGGSIDQTVKASNSDKPSEEIKVENIPF